MVTRVVLLIIILFLGTYSVYSIEELEVKSKIREVCIYPDSALVIRSSFLKLKGGSYKVIFSNIIPEIDENSLKVTIRGENIKLYGAQLKKDYLEDVPSDKIKQLKEEIQELENQIRVLQNTKNLLLEEKNFLDSIRLFSNQQIPKDLVTKMPSIKDLEDTVNFLHTKLKDNYTQVMDCDIKIRDLSNKIDTLTRELSQISTPQSKLKRSIVVELDVLKGEDFELDVSYLVKGASWQPIYDARANFEKSQVELVSYGLVRQRTGEDWDDVELSLSTAKPSIGGRMPDVSSWFIRPSQPKPQYKERRELKSNFLQGITFERDKDHMEGESVDWDYAETKEKGIAVVYKLPRRVTVKSDGSEHKLAISSQILTVNFEYSTYPKVTPFAYLSSRLKNSKNLQLLSGRVNIFLEGDFVGTSSLDNIGAEEEFDLYLGVDENVKVRRELLERKVDDILIAGIPSPNRRVTFKYKIAIENYKGRKIKVNFFEAMPVSEDERIKVKIEKVSLQPKEKDWKDRKGIWRWEVELEPKQKQEIFYNFTIEHPKDIIIDL
ncbi:MAG: mucoidy inhibitor MuiA family protein [Candidatus Omnitrophica bacterium]|nr:mucoidy inhibitor MuiA family protein [Candidatus Omnitrophota bacterium]